MPGLPVTAIKRVLLEWECLMSFASSMGVLMLARPV